MSIERCQDDPTLCFGVNRDGVQNILEVIQEIGRKTVFVQISSSEVFGRVKEGEYKVEGYAEDDEPKPMSNYQKSKAEAERILQDFGQQNPGILKGWYIARAGWLYGAGRQTFVEQFLGKLRQSETLEVISNQWRSPTWTRHFVKVLLDILEAEYPSGIYHITNEVGRGEASTLDIIEVLERYLGQTSAKSSLQFVTRDDIFKIPRAPSNVILNTKLPKLPFWRDALGEFLQEYHPLDELKL